jgi:hypothetical protein
MQFCLYQEGRNVLDIKNKRLTDRESGAICMDDLDKIMEKLFKYENLEDKIHELSNSSDENIIENLVNIFIETIFKGQKHEGFEILTNEDSVLYNEWLKTR